MGNDASMDIPSDASIDRSDSELEDSDSDLNDVVLCVDVDSECDDDEPRAKKKKTNKKVIQVD